MPHDAPNGNTARSPGGHDPPRRRRHRVCVPHGSCPVISTRPYSSRDMRAPGSSDSAMVRSGCSQSGGHGPESAAAGASVADHLATEATTDVLPGRSWWFPWAPRGPSRPPVETPGGAPAREPRSARALSLLSRRRPASTPLAQLVRVCFRVLHPPMTRSQTPCGSDPLSHRSEPITQPPMRRIEGPTGVPGH